MKSPHTEGRAESSHLTTEEIAQMAAIADVFQKITDTIRNAKTVGDILEIDRLVDAIEVE